MQLSTHTAEAILLHASNTPGLEVTGFVSLSKPGTFGSDEVVVPMQNISSTPETDYAWDPKDMLAEYNKMDARGHQPLAFYHSHPAGKSDPSEIDMRSAMQVGLYYLIAYPNPEDRTWHLSAWYCLEQGILVGEPLDIL